MSRVVIKQNAFLSILLIVRTLAKLWRQAKLPNAIKSEEGRSIASSVSSFWPNVAILDYVMATGANKILHITNVTDACPDTPKRQPDDPTKRLGYLGKVENLNSDNQHTCLPELISKVDASTKVSSICSFSTQIIHNMFWHH